MSFKEVLNRKLEEVMTKRVVTIEMDDTLKTVQEIFQRVKFRHLIVIKNKKIAGVISDRDLFKAVSPFLSTLSEQARDVKTLEKRAHQIMSRELVSALKSETVKEGIHRMLDKRVSCLPIVTIKGDIEGIVSWKDILRWTVELVDEK